MAYITIVHTYTIVCVHIVACTYNRSILLTSAWASGAKWVYAVFNWVSSCVHTGSFVSLLLPLLLLVSTIGSLELGSVKFY